MIFIKPAQEDISKLMPLWEAQYRFHHDLDNVYYNAYTQALEARLQQYMQIIVEEGEPSMLVAQESGEPVGFVTFKVEHDDYFDAAINQYGLIIELFVKETYRGQGIGTQLLQIVQQEHFFPQGIEHVRVMASHFNASALNFYEKRGFIQRQIVFYKSI